MGMPPLKALERLIVNSFAEIEAWIRAEHVAAPPVFYCSTDLRNNGHKIAPVDTNLFPGGFNNLAEANYPLAVEAIRRQVDNVCPTVRSAVLVPENHTRNLPYLDNLAALVRLLEMGGISVRLGRTDGEAVTLRSPGGVELPMFPLTRDGGRLRCDGMEPCFVLLNNDLADGLPAVLEGLEIPVLPSPQLGWQRRRKSSHFYQYARVAERFAELLKVDPWLFSAHFSICPKVDFMRREGMECLAAATEEALKEVEEKYRQYGIEDSPFVVIKANTGTYGMSVMRINRPEEVFSLNRKQRSSMAVGKGGLAVSDVLIQEGVRTADTHGVAAAEPVVYMVGGTVVGGFYRVNARRGDSDNLNSRGMSFLPLPFESGCVPPSSASGDDAAARLYVFGVVGRLAGIAASYEWAALEGDGSD